MDSFWRGKKILLQQDLFFYWQSSETATEPESKNVSPRTLSLSLKELENEVIISRKIYAEITPHVEYSLTYKGETLRPIFEAMKEWRNA
ncbi:winged helix-turn-helix transcriptional regulator [Priestia endophytica]